MGMWGIGVAQSDEYCEVYDRFMEEYDSGKDVNDITNGILNEYFSEFDKNDGILHDVYFAIGKAEWMCGQQSEKILACIKEIIDSNTNIEFLRELGADDKDLRTRKKRLITFYESLLIPRDKPRKRKQHKERVLPPVEIGECYAYKFDTGYRIIIILDRIPAFFFKERLCCCILKPTYSKSEITEIDPIHENVGFIGCYTANDFIGISNLKRIGQVSIPRNAYGRIFAPNAIVLSDKKTFRNDFSEVAPIKLSDKLYGENTSKSAVSISINGQIFRLEYNLPLSVKCYDIYAINTDGKYRTFALTGETLKIASQQSIEKNIFCYSWKDPFDSIPTFDELLEHDVMPLGYFKGETFPDTEKLTLIGNFPEMNILAMITADKINPAWEKSLNSLVLERHLYEEYPDEMCMKFGDVLTKANTFGNQ